MVYSAIVTETDCRWCQCLVAVLQNRYDAFQKDLSAISYFTIQINSQSKLEDIIQLILYETKVFMVKLNKLCKTRCLGHQTPISSLFYTLCTQLLTVFSALEVKILKVFFGIPQDPRIFLKYRKRCAPGLPDFFRPSQKLASTAH